MVKRLRRHPLTVESRVRFPLGLPNKSYKEVDELIEKLKQNGTL